MLYCQGEYGVHTGEVLFRMRCGDLTRRPTNRGPKRQEACPLGIVQIEDREGPPSDHDRYVNEPLTFVYEDTGGEGRTGRTFSRPVAGVDPAQDRGQVKGLPLPQRDQPPLVKQASTFGRKAPTDHFTASPYLLHPSRSAEPARIAGKDRGEAGQRQVRSAYLLHAHHLWIHLLVGDIHDLIRVQAGIYSHIPPTHTVLGEQVGHTRRSGQRTTRSRYPRPVGIVVDPEPPIP